MSTAINLADLFRLVENRLIVEGRASIKTFPFQIKPALRILGQRRAANIRYDDIEEYKAARIKEGAAAKTINNELGYIRRAFNLGIKAGKVGPAPPIDSLPICNTRTGFLDPADFARLIRNLPPPIDDVARFAYLTGWRRSEILGLTWREVDLEGGNLQLSPARSKNREPRMFPVACELREILERRAGDRSGPGWVDCEFVFHRQGREIRCFREPWKIAAALIGKKDLLFHDLRRSFYRNARRAGVAEEIVMALAGHKTRAMAIRYRIVDESELSGEVERIIQFSCASV